MLLQEFRHNNPNMNENQKFAGYLGLPMTSILLLHLPLHCSSISGAISDGTSVDKQVCTILWLGQESKTRYASLNYSRPYWRNLNHGELANNHEEWMYKPGLYPCPQLSLIQRIRHGSPILVTLSGS